MARNYNARKWVYVEIAGGIRYVFPSRIRQTLMNELGQLSTSGLATVDKVVVGAQSPKPPKATKSFATGSESSFCSVAKIADLKADGWRISASKVGSYSLDTAFAKSYKITINGIKYAFQSSDLPSGMQFPAGFTDPRDLVDANDTNLIWNPDFPKPPRFSISDGANTISSYCDPSKVDDVKAANGRVTGAKSTLDYFKSKYVDA